MQSMLVVGIILIVGFIFGEIVSRIKLPKVTGYILAGVFLNPDFVRFIPRDFISQTDIVTNIALAVITFSVGGTLFIPRIRKLGKPILWITLCESEFAFVVVALGFLVVTPFFFQAAAATWATTFIPISLLLASLASPTDPSATLAVTHEYKARGDVTSTIMGVAAMDDALGIINYVLAVIVSGALLTHQISNVKAILLAPLFIIGGSVLLGVFFGLIFNRLSVIIEKKTEGVYIVVIIGLLSLCFGLATLAKIDELLSTMVMGMVVVNFNQHREKIFKILERYTDEMIFILFFTLSGMHLNFGIFLSSFVLIFCFVVFRTIGKVAGVYVGAHLSKAKPSIRKFTAGGLIPQGGIVVGLALMMKQNPDFSAIADFIINVVIGATVVHELVGPVLSRLALVKAGEIKSDG